jgi:Protein of unknown function (DUF551).
MTRAKEIKRQAELSADKHTHTIGDWAEHRIGFICGAEWADQHRRWISVEERLPMEYEPVLAAFGSHYARVCFYCGGKWYFDKPNTVDEEVFGLTHWMQIPPPPKKGGEQ